MKIITLTVVICYAFGFEMSPDDIEYQKQIWENTDVIEEDILVLPTMERLAATARKSAPWPNHEIAYNVDSSLDFMKDTIQEAIWHIQNNTCLRFKNTMAERARVTMIYTYGVCNSYVGKTGVTQPLRLYERCNDVGSITHEILHAAGFVHEHKRSDRNGYIQVYWQNIATKHYSQFKKYNPSENILLNDFDYDSIMIYGEYNGANRPGVKAMESTKRGFRLVSPDKKSGMSAGDIEKVKEYYKC